MTILSLATPSHRRGQKLAYSFDEDDITLAWDAGKTAALPVGTSLAAVQLALPAWWWAGMGLVADPAAPLRIEAVPTTAGPSVCIHDGISVDVEAQARAAHSAAPQRTETEWQRHRLAREAPDAEADFPLGAYVTAARHEQVTAERMRCAPGRVASWTSIGAGAAPSEFARLQEAIGAYHVALVELADGRRTVGIWAGAGAPATGMAARPVLRRLFRTQGAWRHGIKFA